MSKTRRQFLGLTMLGLNALGAGRAWSADFPAPGMPIRIIIPAPPGGPADQLARALTPALTNQLSQAAIVIESKPGAGTVLAANLVSRAPADGHTLLLTINATHTQIPHLMAKAPYDPFKDFTPITQLARAGLVVCAHQSVAAGNLKELVEHSKANGPVSAASAGLGTTGHLCIEMLNRVYGAKLNFIPYKGAAEAQVALQGGFVQVYFDTASSAIPQVKAGKVKALAVTGPSRMEALPDVPTAVELGYPQLSASAWFALFGPPDMPPAVVSALNQAFVQGLRAPDIRKQFAPVGFELTGTTAKELEAIVRTDYEVWGKIIRETGIRLGS